MKKLVISLSALFFSLGLSAQSDMLLYNFNAIAQSLHTNPAMPQQTKVWVGLPAMSGVSFHYHNSGFSPVDLLEKGTNINANLFRIARNLDEKSQLAVSQSMDVLGIGFKVNKGFISIGANQQFDLRMDLPFELIQAFYTPDGSITNLNISTFDLETMVRTNFYAGYQHKFMDDRLTIGFRVNYVMVQSHAYIERFNLSLQNDSTYTTRASSDILVRTSGPAGPAGLQDLGNGNNLDIMGLALPQNNGLGLNFGVHYKVNDKVDVSASVLDIGAINYTTNNLDYISQGNFDFEGITFDDDFNDNSGSIGDSIEAAFDFAEVEGRQYTKSLMTRAFGAVNYNLSEKHSIGLLFHTRVWNGDLFNDYGFNYVGRWGRFFQFTAGYSIINGTMHNIGAGFDMKLGPLQLYLISDNIFGAVDYTGLQTTNVRVGLNLSFYGRRNKAKDAQEEKIQEQQESGETAQLSLNY